MKIKEINFFLWNYYNFKRKFIFYYNGVQNYVKEKEKIYTLGEE